MQGGMGKEGLEMEGGAGWEIGLFIFFISYYHLFFFLAQLRICPATREDHWNACCWRNERQQGGEFNQLAWGQIWMAPRRGGLLYVGSLGGFLTRGGLKPAKLKMNEVRLASAGGNSTRPLLICVWRGPIGRGLRVRERRLLSVLHACMFTQQGAPGRRLEVEAPPGPNCPPCPLSPTTTPLSLLRLAYHDRALSLIQGALPAVTGRCHQHPSPLYLYGGGDSGPLACIYPCQLSTGDLSTIAMIRYFQKSTVTTTLILANEAVVFQVIYFSIKFLGFLCAKGFY